MSDVLTDPTPVAAGEYVTIGYYQNVLGALNVLTPWRSLAQQWANYLPNDWAVGSPVVNDGLALKNAVVQVRVPGDTTLGAMATVANAVSADVGIRSVTDNGAQPVEGTGLQRQAVQNNPTVGTCLDDPIQCLQHLLTEGLIVVAVVAGIAALVYVKPWKYLPKRNA